MSSANAVRICMAESLRFLEEGSSAPGQSGAKVRPNGVADAQTVEIPSPPKELSTGTHLKSQSRVTRQTQNKIWELSRVANGDRL